MPPSSSEVSESIDVEQLEDTSQNDLIRQESSESSFSHNYEAMEFEEGIHVTLSSVSNYQDQTFESKPSSTYIDSNEEFMYSSKDLLPGPLNLELVQNKFSDPNATLNHNKDQQDLPKQN